MRWRFLVQVVLGVALVVGIVALGAGVYQAGYAAGAVNGGGTVAVPPLGYGFGWGWHGGFGIFGFLGFLLFFFLLIGLFRAIAWGGRGWRGGPGAYGSRGPWGPAFGPGHDHSGVERRPGSGPEWLEDWHRHAHGTPGEGEPGRSGADRPDAPGATDR